ncbi:hypothetical protein [Kribbella capetownensis]|uniref:hypothetical protein n=1 Tax=Kribbella capetownensis TaxID=1572659 RepID=UPI001EDE4986|nr:hypothetical protein [Kribbella capetownensis]
MPEQTVPGPLGEADLRDEPRLRPRTRLREVPVLRLDPAQLPRIEEMTANATDRLAEAKDQAWLGEVAALEDSLKHLRQRRAEAEQQRTNRLTTQPPTGG